MYSLLVADDHPLFRDALQVVISSGLPQSQLLEADSLAAAMPLIAQHDSLDLLLLDLSLPDAEGLDGLTRLREAYPGCRWRLSRRIRSASWCSMQSTWGRSAIFPNRRPGKPCSMR